MTEFKLRKFTTALKFVRRAELKLPDSTGLQVHRSHRGIAQSAWQTVSLKGINTKA